MGREFHSKGKGYKALMKNSLFRLGARMLVPAWAKEMDEEGVFRLREQQAASRLEERDYLIVENVGADVTVFAFSGLDGLFGVAPRFEFRGLFSKFGGACNLVFVRELRGFFYHLAPDGSTNGLAHFEERLCAIKNELGAKHNMTIGFSAGGAAAFYFGTRCGMQKILAFSPAFPTSVYTAPGAQLRHYLNLKKLITDPKAYIELAAVSNWGLLAEHKLRNALGSEAPWDVMKTYRECPSRPRASVVFGQGCRQDSIQAQGLADLPEVKLVPVSTGFHNVPGFLKERGELAPLVSRELSELVGNEAVLTEV